MNSFENWRNKGSIKIKRCAFYCCKNNSKICDLLFFPFPKSCFLVRSRRIEASTRHLNTCPHCHKCQKWLFLCKLDVKVMHAVHQRYVCAEHFVEGCPSEMYPEPLPIEKVMKIMGSKRNRNIITPNSSLPKNEGERLENSTKTRSINDIPSVSQKKTVFIEDFSNILSETSLILQEAHRKVLMEVQRSEAAVTNLRKSVLDREAVDRSEDKDVNNKMSKLQRTIGELQGNVANSYMITEVDKKKFDLVHFSPEALQLRKENENLRNEIICLNNKILELENQLQVQDPLPMVLDSNEESPMVLNSFETPTILLVTADDQ